MDRTTGYLTGHAMSNVTTNNPGELNLLVFEANEYIDRMVKANKPVTDSFFQALAVRLSRNNIENPEGTINGGPFGAIIVQYPEGFKDGKGVGKPKVVGVGANHVFPQSDPSAHAEMVAYRDAAERLKKTDFSDCALFTSCACCPMCLGIANSVNFGSISYVNTPEQAKNIAGFADDLQYHHFELPRDQQMTPIDKLPEERRESLKKALGDHGAVVVDKDGNVIGTGDSQTETDPTMLPSLAAVRAATKASKNMFVPEGCTLVCRNIPHPSGFIVADWARMLRDRDSNAPDDPGKDKEVIDPSRIIYVNPDYEQALVSDGKGGSRVTHPSEEIYKQPLALLKGEATLIPTTRHVSSLDLEKHPNTAAQIEARKVFELWHEKTGMGAAVKY